MTHTPCPPLARRLRGFTLVELLVVIGIVATLIAILLPSLNRARDSARKVQCASNLRSQGQLLVLYAGDWQGKYPPGYGGEGDLEDGQGNTYTGNWPFGNLAYGDSSTGIFVPAGMALLFEQGYLDRPTEMLFCPALNPQIRPDNYWNHDPIFRPQWNTSYSNYCYWASWTPPDNNWVVGPDERKGTGRDGEEGGADPAHVWARDLSSPADTVMMSELNSQLGPLADKGGPGDSRRNRRWLFVNHIDPAVDNANGRPVGGNVMNNDGSVRFVGFGDMKWRMQYGTDAGLSFYY